MKTQEKDNLKGTTPKALFGNPIKERDNENKFITSLTYTITQFYLVFKYTINIFPSLTSEIFVQRLLHSADLGHALSLLFSDTSTM
jgi:hypothetical protein